MIQREWPNSLAGVAIEEFLRKAEEFHGHISPGVVTGGFLVDAALSELPPTEHLNAVTETVVCLPDAVQILTQCTLGNSFLQVLDWGKFAVTFYDRMSLRGVRAWLVPELIEAEPIVASWYLRNGQKVDKEVVIRELLGCGRDLVRVRHVTMRQALKNTEKVPTVICPECGECYPIRWGDRCLACAGQAYYD